MTLQLQDSEDNEDELRELISRLRKYLNADKYFLVYNHNFASVFLLSYNKFVSKKNSLQTYSFLV